MSLDFGLFAKLIVDAVYPGTKDKDRKETYENDDMNVIPFANKWSSINFPAILGFIISIILGVVAFMLSWTCNTALGYHVALKTFFGVISFVFGLSYIILYILLRWDTCSRLMSSPVGRRR